MEAEDLREGVELVLDRDCEEYRLSEEEKEVLDEVGAGALLLLTEVR